MIADAQEAMHKSATFFFGAGGVAVGGAAALAATTGLLLLTSVVAPDSTARCSAALRRRHGLSFLCGLGVFALFLAGAKLAQHLHFIGVPWIICAVVASTIGLTATAEDVGRRLFAICGREGNRALHLVSGWAVFAAAGAIPFLGWFVIAPVGLLSGLGSIVMAIVTRKEGAAPAPATP